MKGIDADIVLLCNPTAGGRWKGLAGILDSEEAKFVRRVVTDSIDDVGPALVSLSRRAELLCIYGGDGTIQRVLDALYLTDRPFDKQPRLAFIGGGTMNVGARWCGLTRSPHRNFRDVIGAYRRGELSTREVPLLRVHNGEETHYGLTFGLGPLVRILSEYERGRKGKLAAVGAGVKGIAAVWSKWPEKWQSVVAEAEAEVFVDGEKLPFERYSAIFCSVTGNLNPTVEPFARARTQDTFHCLAYAVGPRELVLAAPLLWRGYLPIDSRSLLNPISTWKQIVLSYFGKGLVPSDPRYVNATAQRFSVASAERYYTVDGEVIRSNSSAIEVTLGPRLGLVVGPTAALGPLAAPIALIAQWAPRRRKPE